MQYNLENRPVISIAMLVYNHEKYLEQALQSIFDQKIDVSFEVVIGEDYSSDNSRKIIKEWMKKFPERIRLLPQEHNLGMHENFNRVLFACDGKYVAWLEGDDFWLDDHKLQKQYSFLEGHSDYIGVTGNVFVVDAAGNRDLDIQQNYPLQKEGDFELKDLAKGRKPGQTGTFFYKNIFKEMNQEDRDLICSCHTNGDIRLLGILLLSGKIKIMPEAMSAYRFVAVGGSNWNSLTHGKNYSEIYYDKILELEVLLSALSGEKITLNVARYRHIASALLMAVRSHKKEDNKIFKNILRKEKNKTGAMFYCGKLAVKHIVK